MTTAVGAGHCTHALPTRDASPAGVFACVRAVFDVLSLLEVNNA